MLVECLKSGILDPYLRPIEPVEASLPSTVAGGSAQGAENGDVPSESKRAQLQAPREEKVMGI